MIPDRQFQVVYMARTPDGTTECRERLTIKPETYDQKMTFESVRNAFLTKTPEKMLKNVLVTAISEVDGDGNLLKVL